MMSLTKSWVVMKITDRPSKYGSYIKEVTFANTNWEIAHTYLDEDNRNYNRWRDIVNGYENGFGIVVNGLKIKQNSFHKKTNEPLVNADSIVKVVYVEDRMQDLLDSFVEALEE